MKNGLPTKPLAELCEFRNGLWKGKKPPYVHVGVIRNTNFNADGTLDDSNIAFHDVETKQFKTRQLTFGDIILEKSGGGPKQPVGRVITFEKNGKFSFSNFTSIIRVCDPNNLDFRYLHRVLYWYYASGVTEGMQRRSTGIRNLDFNAYKQLAIPVPPLPEQRRIVGILDEAFAGIATAKANAEKNLQNARALFESHLNAVFTQRGDEWTDKPLETVAAIINGYAFKSGDFSSTKGVKCIKITNVGIREFVFDANEFLPANFANEYSGVLVKRGSIVLALTRTIISGGLKVAIVPPGFDGALLNQRVASILADSDELIASFLFDYLCTQHVVHYVLDRVNTLMQPNLSIKDLRAMPIPIPSLREQQRITRQVAGLREETQRLESIYQRKLAALDELKKSLLHQAFSGQL